MKHTGYKTILCAALACMGLVHGYDQVYVENDTPNPVAVALVRTKNEHMRLDFTQNKSGEGLAQKMYQWPTGDVFALEELTFIVLAPGEGYTLPNYSKKLNTDRDLWFSYDLNDFARNLAKGGRSQKTQFYNVGSFVKSVYIGENSSGKLEGFSSREKALSASGISLNREALQIEGVERVRIIRLADWLNSAEPQQKRKKPSDMRDIPGGARVD